MPPKKKGKPASSSTSASNRRGRVGVGAGLGESPVASLIPLPPASTSTTSSSPPTRTTRASARVNKAIAGGQQESAITTTYGKRKRESGMNTIIIDSDDDRPTTRRPPYSTRKAPATDRRSTTMKKPSRENWFEEYADPDSHTINVATFPRWMDDLQVSYEGVFMYYILWKCKAETAMTITKEEFIGGMMDLGVESNDQLLMELPRSLAGVCPRKKPKTNPEFMPFYRWCFNHFKESGAKNLPINVAVPLFQTLLDAERYSLSWKPYLASDVSRISESSSRRGEFPHVDVFVEFLDSNSARVAVITKDQYEQFYEFNQSVSWDLSEYSEETSTWPTLLDSYVTWREEKGS